jgi:branched-chain amino acid transport system ATP-binding protein
MQAVNAGYGPFDVLKNFSIEVEPGETVALIGANGAGKTTVLRVLSGLLPLRNGKVLFSDNDISQVPAHSRVGLGLSHVPERRGIFANLSVYENLVVGGYLRKLRDSDFEEVYSLFPILKQRSKQSAGTLSGGEQQMLAISRALLCRPKMVLLDEPSLGLAPQITRTIFETIQRINAQGTTVLLVEQNAVAALRISSRAYVIESGEVRHSGKSSELKENDLIRKTYMGEA